VDFIKDRKIQISHYVKAMYPWMIMLKLSRRIWW